MLLASVNVINRDVSASGITVIPRLLEKIVVYVVVVFPY